jgi:non-heme chloroperoxidase
VTSRVQANGISLHVVDRGEGRPLVLLHGVMGSGRFFDAQVERLSGRFRVVAPDLRGHGDSDKPMDGHTVAQHARDLRAVLEALGATDRPVLVGWSMGVMVAYEYVRAYGSSSVAGLVVVDQPPADFAWEEGYAFGLFTPEILAEAVEGIQTDLAAVGHEWAELMLHAPTPEAVAFFVGEFSKVPPAIATSILVDQTLRDYRGFIPTIDVPTLVAFGVDDKATSPEAGRWIADRIAGARLELFEESSHAPFFEEPDRFARVLEEFVSGL